MSLASGSPSRIAGCLTRRRIGVIKLREWGLEIGIVTLIMVLLLTVAIMLMAGSPTLPLISQIACKIVGAAIAVYVWIVGGAAFWLLKEYEPLRTDAEIVHTYDLIETPEGQVILHPETRARLYKAIRVWRYQENPKPVIILPQAGVWVGGTWYNVADMERDYILELEPNARVVGLAPKEGETTDGTRGEVIRALELLRDKKQKWVAFVSNRLHLRRICWLVNYYAKRMGIEIEFQPLESPCRLPLSWALGEIFITQLICWLDRGENSRLFLTLQRFWFHRRAGG